MMETAAQEHSSDSRLSTWCQGMMESVWLAAVGMMPLMLSPRGTLGAYEAPKLAFLQMLALLGLAAWGVWQVEKRFPHRSARLSPPLVKNRSVVIVLTLFALSIALSTLLSIDPATSFWGSLEVYQGALSRGAEFILFVLVVSHLRTREQIERLVAVVLLTSFALALHAIVQWCGWDPIRPEARGGRVSATLGNPIYFAGYLMMIIPLTIWKILDLKTSKTHSKRLKQALQTLFWIILCTQVIAVLLTSSRGPVIAAGASLFTFALIYARLRGWKMVLRTLTALAVCAVLAVGAYLWASQRNASADGPSLSFMGARGDSGRGETWNKAGEMLLSHSDQVPPALAGDPWQSLRMWIGHGPETLPAVLPFYHSVQGSLVLESWFHNIVWDFWWGYGLLGAGLFLTFFGLLFYLGYQRLGWIVSSSQVITFWATLIALTLLGACVPPLLFNNAGYAGLGAVLGLASALILFPVWSATVHAIKLPAPEQSHLVLIAALTAALAGHLVDLAFAFPTASSLVLFWIYAGVVVVLCQDRERLPAASETAPQALIQPTQTACNFPLPVAIALVCAGLIALLHICIDPCGNFSHRFSISELLSTALFNLDAAKGPVSLMILPLVLYWIGASLVLAVTPATKDFQNAFFPRLTRILGWSGAGGLLFALLESFLMTQAVPLPEMRILSAAALERVHDQEILYLGELGIILALVILTGSKLVGQKRYQVSGSRPGWAVCILSFLVASVLIWSVVLVPGIADLFVQDGLSMQASGRASLSSDLFRHALSLNPRPFVYRSMLSESLITDSEVLNDDASARRLLAEAESVLKNGRQHPPVNRTAYYLGRVYMHWALRETGETRAKLADQASKAFDQARDFEPYAESVWCESGIAQLLLQQDTAAARSKLDRARELASQFFVMFSAQYSSRSLRTRDAGLKQQYAEVAEAYYDGTIQDTKLEKKVTSQARLGKGLFQLMTKRIDAAIANLTEAVKLEVENDQWEIEMLLAEAFLQKGERTAARKHLERSVAKVPPQKKHMLRSLQLELAVP
jgi:tetratricopeptide (TPR) repeat protein